MKNICFKSLITVVMLLCGVVSRAEYVNIDGLVYDISADTKTATVVHHKYIYEHAVDGFSFHGCECGEYSGEIVVPAEYLDIQLFADNKKQLMIPRGFAHGFLVVSDTAEFAYKCDDVYNHAGEGGLKWNDSEVGIVWPEVPGMKPEEYLTSEKDGKWPSLEELRNTDIIKLSSELKDSLLPIDSTKPISICLPANLRNYYETNTISSFIC